MKAKTIDRLELTKQKFSTSLHEPKPEIPEENHDEHYGLSTCPNCEQLTLIHEGGCDRCPNCGWSACG